MCGVCNSQFYPIEFEAGYPQKFQVCRPCAADLQKLLHRAKGAEWKAQMLDCYPVPIIKENDHV